MFLLAAIREASASGQFRGTDGKLTSQLSQGPEVTFNDMEAWKGKDGTASHWKYVVDNVIVYRNVYRGL